MFVYQQTRRIVFGDNSRQFFVEVDSNLADIFSSPELLGSQGELIGWP